MQNMLGAFQNQVDGVGMVDTYNKAKGNTLAGLAFNSQGDARQGHLAELAKYNPVAAQAMKTKLDEQDYEGLVKASKLLVSLKGNPELANQAYQRMKPQYAALGMNLPEQLDQSVWQSAEQIAAAYGDGGDTPGNLKYFNAMSAGLNTDEMSEARRIALGLAPRKSSAALQYKEVTGADGRKRIIAFNPNDPSGTIIEGNSQQGGGSQPSSIGTAEQVSSVIQQMVNNGVPVAEANQWGEAQIARINAATGMGNYQQAAAHSPGAFVSRTPEENAAAERTATLGVDLQMAPAVESAKAEAAAVGKTRGERAGALEKKTTDAKTTIALLDEAEALLGKATGGYFGAQADAFYGTFGKSTEGARANAELDVISPQLIGMVPRMEGPQSDADRKLYERAAGDLNNPNKPASIRLASLKQMRRLAMKYANVGQQSASAGNGWSYGGVK